MYQSLQMFKHTPYFIYFPIISGYWTMGFKTLTVPLYEENSNISLIASPQAVPKLWVLPLFPLLCFMLILVVSETCCCNY